jgi:hypothetical protein
LKPFLTTDIKTMLKRLFILTLTFWLTIPVLAQQESKSSADKAEEIIKRAIEVLGGRQYLGVQSLTGRGRYTPYQDGTSELPIKFTDYLIYPDKERIDFDGPGIKSIQVNIGKGGWLYDGMLRKIKDIEASQAESFQLSIKTSIDNLLRGWWRKEKAELSYVGRREAGLAKRNEAVRLTYPDGFIIDFEFGAKDGLPAKVLYKSKNKDGEEIEEETRFAQYVTFDGITTPLVIDHFKDGKQSSRINFEEIKYNYPIAEGLFQKPANVKDLKQEKSK